MLNPYLAFHSLLPRRSVFMCSALFSRSAFSSLIKRAAFAAFVSLTAIPMSHAQDNTDPHQWLENVESADAIAWARKQNATSERELQSTDTYTQMYPTIKKILDAADRIPAVEKHGDRLYNFWRDAQHPRGVWRRTTEAEYASANPAWETVLDLDALNARDNVNWVWKTAKFLEQGAYRSRPDRCLVLLARGGSDAVVVREFDIVKLAFVDPSAGGFSLPEAKTDVDWRTRDALYVSTDFGPGSMSPSGYPLRIKEWKRGTPLASATMVYEGERSDVGSGITVTDAWGRRTDIFSRVVTRYNIENFIRDGDTLRRIDVPRDAKVSVFQDRLLVHLRSDWMVAGKRQPQGALLAVPLSEVVATGAGSGRSPGAAVAGIRTVDVLFEPSDRVILHDYVRLKDVVLLRLLDNVRTRLVEVEPAPAGRTWSRRDVKLDPLVTWQVAGIEPNHSGNDYFAIGNGYLTPPALYRMRTGADDKTLLKSQPERFSARGLSVRQFEATSKDGTKVPYFLVGRADLPLDGSNPTILYGYGGYEISQRPSYSTTFGVGWLERGGVLAVANLRGGGEFGPKWHQAALREKRQNSFDDFIAVAENLIARKITAPRHLGIMGGSHGGLLVGVAMTQRPDLFNAVISSVPLLDMKRYSKLLAGASWMSEYGDPDTPEDWAIISKYSPYQNVKKGVRYPKTFFSTSTRDDRVHPGHARKMVARMQEQGHTALYYENIEGGHANAADNTQSARIASMQMSFMSQQLGIDQRKNDN